MRSTLGPSITETPGSALGEAEATNVSLEIPVTERVCTMAASWSRFCDPVAGFLPFPPLVRFFGPMRAGSCSASTPLISPRLHTGAIAARRTYGCEVTFNAFPGERIYGLGQHQHGLFDQKGTVIDLIQRNTEVCVPFALSNRGYGFLWNMPGVGRVELAANRTRWVADAARQLDYWVTTGLTPAEIVSRYSTSDRLAPHAACLGVVASGSANSATGPRTSSSRWPVSTSAGACPLSVIVVDYFHWTRQGEWKFDTAEWPDPQAMVDELRGMGVELMVSIWPTVNPASENYCRDGPARALVGNVRGLPLHLPSGTKADDGQTFVRFYDPTNPEARRYIWQKVTEGYRRYGIRAFWLDACEPEMRPEDPESNFVLPGLG